MGKIRKSKLDRFEAQLLEMDTAHKTLVEMRAWLAGQSCKISGHGLSHFLTSARSRADQERWLKRVTSASAQCQELDKAFAKNPAPKLEMLIKLFKTLIMRLTLKGAEAPELLSLANRLTSTVCDFVSEQTKAAFKEREVRIQEEKFAEAKKDEQAKALELCLDEAMEFPAVVELFRQAFAALKAAQGGAPVAEPAQLQIANTPGGDTGAPT